MDLRFDDDCLRPASARARAALLRRVMRLPCGDGHAIPAGWPWPDTRGFSGESGEMSARDARTQSRAAETEAGRRGVRQRSDVHASMSASVFLIGRNEIAHRVTGIAARPYPDPPSGRKPALLPAEVVHHYYSVLLPESPESSTDRDRPGCSIFVLHIVKTIQMCIGNAGRGRSATPRRHRGGTRAARRLRRPR